MQTATATTTSPIIAAAVNLGDLTVSNTTSSWTDDQWADYIKEKLAQSVLSIIEAGSRIAEYKASVHAVKQTGFETFCKERLRISKQFANILVAISEWFKNRKPEFPILPTSVRTLYELTRLTETEFQQAIQSGAIHPEMTRAEAEALRSNRPAQPQTKTLPAASNQAPQARDNTPSPTPVTPTEPEEDEDAPFDLGPPEFVDSSTPAPNPPKTPDVEGTEEGEDMRFPKRKGGTPDIDAMVKDPLVKQKNELNKLLVAVGGGYHEGSTHLSTFMDVYNKQINAPTVFTHMQGIITQALSEGDSIETAKEKALNASKEMQQQILNVVNQAFSQGTNGILSLVSKLSQAEPSMLSMAFRPDTPVNEASNAARMCLKRMGFDPEKDV